MNAAASPNTTPVTGDPAPTIVAFDIGEVVIDETRVWATWADIIGVSPLTFGAVLGVAIADGLGWEDVFDELAPNMVWQDFEDEHEARYGGFRDDDVYGDVRDCLTALQADGLKVVLCGNQPARRQAQLTALDLPHDAMAMSDDLGVEKPDPRFWERLLELAGAESAAEVLYVGDRVDNDVLSAMQAGLKTCWLRRGPWGRLHDLPDNVEADLVLEGLGELPMLIKAWRDDLEAANAEQSTPSS